MSKNNYKTGDWNIICDVCAKKFKASEAKERWDGLVVCPDDFETRQPQDFVQTRQDKMTVPFSRPRPPDVFVVVPYPLYWDSNYVMDGYIDGDIL